VVEQLLIRVVVWVFTEKEQMELPELVVFSPALLAKVGQEARTEVMEPPLYTEVDLVKVLVCLERVEAQCE
jgi:hypothetical protein